MDVVKQAMWVDKESAEGLKKLEHFLEALTEHQRHLRVSLVFEFQKVGVPGRPWHKAREVAVEGVDEGVIDVEDHI